MGAAEILVSGGVAAVLAAVAGGGLKAFGVELPLLATVKRQVLVMIVGAGLIALGLMSGEGMLHGLPADGNGAAQANASAPAPANASAAQGQEVNAATPQVPASAPAQAAAPAAAEGPPAPPDVAKLGFPEARRKIIGEGWSPIFQEANPLENPQLGLRGQEIVDSGFREAVSCSGSGSAPCLLRYGRRGYVLELVVLGETLQSGTVDSVGVLDCHARQRPEGCAAGN
jgi:hypothetical protein